MNEVSWIWKAIVIVLAIIGLLAVLSVAGMAIMHVGMMHGAGFCGSGMGTWR